MCLQERKTRLYFGELQSAGRGLCKIELPNGVSAMAYLVTLTPVNIGAPCESCCVEYMCRVDLHAASLSSGMR